MAASKDKPAEAARLFNEELFNGFETLGDLAQEYGVRTLTDLMYLQAAILSGGFIDAWVEHSNVLEVIKLLPSGERWGRYVSVYDISGGLIRAAEAPLYVH